MWGFRRKKKTSCVGRRSVHSCLVNFQCNRGRKSWTIYEGYEGQTPLFNAKWLRGRSGHKLQHGVDALLCEIVGVREGNNYSRSVFSILTSVRDAAVLRTFAVLRLPLASATVDRQGCIVLRAFHATGTGGWLAVVICEVAVVYVTWRSRGVGDVFRWRFLWLCPLLETVTNPVKEWIPVMWNDCPPFVGRKVGSGKLIDLSLTLWRRWCNSSSKNAIQQLLGGKAKPWHA